MKKNISRCVCCRATAALMLALLAMTGCEKMNIDQQQGEAADIDVTITFTPTSKDITRASASTYFSKLNVQLFDTDGNKVFDKVKTQTAEDDGDTFGTLSLKLTQGTYTIVAVGHSSVKSATIKSPEAVQFTATDGEKLTDTFCHCSQITIGEESQTFSLPMNRVGAMVQFCLEDEEVPESFAYFKIDYTGGSANFNPTTFEGITKSTQSENRIRNSLNIYQAYTFPYLATSCQLKMTVSATDSDGTIIRQRTFEGVPVTRNKITSYHGPFFRDGDGRFTQTDFGFVIHADWDGEDSYTF